MAPQAWLHSCLTVDARERRQDSDEDVGHDNDDNLGDEDEDDGHLCYDNDGDQPTRMCNSSSTPGWASS